MLGPGAFETWCVPSERLCFSQPCGAPTLRTRLPSKPNAPGFFLPMPDSQAVLECYFYVGMPLCNFYGLNIFCWWSQSVKSLSRVWLLWSHGLHSLPGSSVHGILQARVMKWVAIAFSRGSSRLRAQTWVSCIAGRFFTIWAIFAGRAVLIWMSATSFLRVCWVLLPW